jgi:hypothetical protein
VVGDLGAPRRTKASRSIIAYFVFFSWTRWAWLMILMAYCLGGLGEVGDAVDDDVLMA